MKIIYTNPDGSLTVVDNREFYSVKEGQLAYIREHAKELILATAPEYKQRNAALGLLSEQETQTVKDFIQNVRNISNQLEAQITAITWDGDPQTHAAACDAVQAIVWE